MLHCWVQELMSVAFQRDERIIAYVVLYVNQAPSAKIFEETIMPPGFRLCILIYMMMKIYEDVTFCP